MKLRLLRHQPLLLFLLFTGQAAFARAGGGHSFSGGGHGGFSGGHSYGGGGGGGDGGGEALGELIFWIIRLSFQRPLVGLPLDVVIIYVVFLVIRARGHDYVSEAAPPPREMVFRRADLARLMADDANFSFPYFADFTYALFSEVHKARGKNRLADYSSYLSENAISQLHMLAPQIQECKGIVVGGWSILRASLKMDGNIEVRVAFEANYSEIVAEKETRWYAREVWAFTRKAGVQSKAPDEMSVKACPNCGAPLEYSGPRVCKSCGQKIDDGSFNWFVSEVIVRREARPPLLQSDSEEVGTDLPTQYARDFEEQFALYQKSHPEFALPAFIARASEIFVTIQRAWSERKWEVARPYESDRLFLSHYYWIEEYKRQGLRNSLGDVRIGRIEPAALVQDRFATTLTVRIYASMIDITVNEAGQVMSGSSKAPRVFSEYWTFLRGQGAAGKPMAKFGHCPSCGAEMKVGMAGTCEYCGNKITTGDFDWVLSMIEQDEEYQA
jgi:hypothetical protein